MSIGIAAALESLNPGSAEWVRLRMYGGGSQGAELWGTGSGLRVVVKRHLGAPIAEFEAIARRVEALRGAGVPAPATSVTTDGDAVLLVHDYLPGDSDPPLTASLVEDLLEISGRGRDLADDSATGWTDLIRTSLRAGLEGYCEHHSLEAFSDDSRSLLTRVRATGEDASIDELVADDLVHYDLHPDNILSVDGTSISGIVDWDAVRSGDRSLDLALLSFTSSWRATDDVLEQLWAGFFASGTRDARAIYMHHVVLRLVDWIIRHGNGPGAARIIELGTWALSITSSERFSPPGERT